MEGSWVCPAPWEGEAGRAEQFNSVISEEGDCRKLKDVCFLEGKLKNKGITLTTNVPILKIMLVAESCLTLCDPMESDSSVHQAPLSREFSR